MAELIYSFNLAPEEYAKCKEFGKCSAPTQRGHRSGGKRKRDVKEVEEDTFRGKRAEVVFQKFFGQPPLSVDLQLDFGVFPRGVWDKSDITYKGVPQSINVKSAKFFSRWLLVETKDFLREPLKYYVFITINKSGRGGTVRGYAPKELLDSSPPAVNLRQGELIPNTNTWLDADNRGLHKDNLLNSLEEWLTLAEAVKAGRARAD